jgi:hypothetical protein
MDDFLRPLLWNERRLYREKLARISAMLNSRGLNLNDEPPEAIVREATLVIQLFDAIGFVDTEAGPMMRVEEDVLDLERTANMREAIQADVRKAEQAMRFGPSLRPR